MPQINRSKGTTASERYIARLADRTFLDLWSYPNVYRDTVVNGRRAGKELCDLLVVCGDHIIIFSIKHISWYDNKDLHIGWPRWYNRAIKKSVTQIRRAERWITQFPDRIFLGPVCGQSLPIPIPRSNTRNIYGVIVALGAHEAANKFFSGESGSFMIAPSIVGDAHLYPKAAHYFPFAIGDVDPNGRFIHVMNDATLDIIMRELDTITDFSEYLSRKAAFLRSGHLMMAAGEEDLLAYYLTHMDSDHDAHGFVHPENRPWAPEARIALDNSHYSGMTKNPQYIRKKQADKDSYIWDRLIGVFTENMLAGTTMVPDGSTFEIAKYEIGVRYMAQEPRLMRRALGQGILGLIANAQKHPRAFRMIIPPPDKPGRGLGYAFLMLAHPKKALDGGYEQYRQARINMLLAYCDSVLYKFPHLKRIIGIASEPPPGSNGPKGSSEDMIMLEAPVKWTPEHLAELEQLRMHFGIFKEDRIRTGFLSGIEYPDAPANQEDPKQ